MAAEIVSTIITAITTFISGMGGAFVTAFQEIFMTQTSEGVYSGMNELGIFLLVFLGVSLGYGVIRWVTGLVRGRM